MSLINRRQYNEEEVLADFLLHTAHFVRGHGLKTVRWYEDHVSGVVPGNNQWSLSGQVFRRLFRFFQNPVFQISIRLGWQEEDGEIRRLLYWSVSWKDHPSHDFSSLMLGLEEKIAELANLLGKDGVIFEPSAEQLAHELFGEKPKKTNGSGRHTPDQETEIRLS